MTEELGGFQFNFPPSEPLELNTMGEDNSCKIFEVGLDGSVRIHGYTVNEVSLLLETYRAHVLEMTRTMQSLQSGADEVRYRPEGE